MLITVDHDPRGEFPDLLDTWAANTQHADFAGWLRARYADNQR